MIRIENIYYMLAYAFHVLQEQGYKDVLTEEFENVEELLSAILCHGVSVQLKRGLHRQYISKEEPLSSPKGKLEINESIKTSVIRKKQLVCSYDEFSVDGYLNRIIKTTMEQLLCVDISKARKKEIRKLLVFLQDVSALDVHNINWKLRYDRNNQTYQMLIAICEMIIKGLLHSNTDGTTSVMDFLDEQTMPKLYEKFILSYFQREYKNKGIKAYSPQIKWRLDDDMGQQLPTMQSDIVISCEETKKTLIIDAKYYAHNMQVKAPYMSHTIHSANLYQIFTYVKNWDVKEGEIVSGMLLYARTDDEIQPDNTYQMSGNKINVRTLDLNCRFDEIKEQLDGVARMVTE